VYRALDRLGTAERLAWTLRHVEGERLDAVAQLCGCSLATAKRRIAAANAHVRKLTGATIGEEGDDV
jgi:RNA polymerase sigma-70 factor (ECF subfamily)